MGYVKNLLLGISIAIIFTFFVGFGIQAFYPAPEYSDYCKDEFRFDSYNTRERCEDAGGRWNVYGNYPKPVLSDNQMTCTRTQTLESGEFVLNCMTREEQEAASGYCDLTYECSEQYTNASESYTKIVFILTSFIGLVTMIIGGFVLRHDSVSPGLMGGGFFTIMYGIIRYWQFAGDILRFLILGIILAMLIYLAYRRFSFLSGNKA